MKPPMPEYLNASVLVLLLALAIEVGIGDPHTRWHPVALFGRTIEAILRGEPSAGRMSQLAFGMAIVALSVAGVTALAAGLLSAATSLHPAAGIVVGAMAFKTSFAYRQLEQEAATVAAHVGAEQIGAARTALRALVSRDTQTLSPEQAASAAVESVAENLSDSFVAPLFYFAIFGVPGALAYRAINTLDAMIGYHGQYEYIGRAAAKLDDLANIVPARLTALLLVAASALTGADAAQAARIAVRDHGRTESPNAGWPMAAMAGALGVQLEKVNHYRLGDAERPCRDASIRSTIAIARWTAALAMGTTLIGVSR